MNDSLLIALLLIALSLQLSIIISGTQTIGSILTALTEVALFHTTLEGTRRR